MSAAHLEKTVQNSPKSDWEKLHLHTPNTMSQSMLVGQTQTFDPQIRYYTESRAYGRKFRITVALTPPLEDLHFGWPPLAGRCDRSCKARARALFLDFSVHLAQATPYAVAPCLIVYSGPAFLWQRQKPDIAKLGKP